MIQRIQSLYLLLANVLSVLALANPLATFATEDSIYILKAAEISTDSAVYLSTTPLFILLCITAFISLISLFLYKKRMLQIRLSFFNIVVLIGFIGLFAYYLYPAANKLEATISYSLFATFPIIAAILTYLAVRAIGKDEALVRSLDRIR